MDLPVSDIVIEEDDSTELQCNFSDLEVVDNIAQLLLKGMVIACVDNTKGDPFKSPASVAVSIRTEMVNNLIQRGKECATNVVNQDGFYESESIQFPVKIISSFIDEFASSKRNLLSRVSGWLPSDSRDGRIDNFVQEVETEGLWPIHTRVAVAETLLRYVDFENKWHCHLSFVTSEQLLEHKSVCIFHPLHCENEGCISLFSANQSGKHDVECQFKILPCRQKCPQKIVRHEMDKHCNTICPMKLVSCPFYQAGCESSFPQGTTEQHFADFLHSHLLNILHTVHRQEEAIEELKQQVILLEKSQSLSERSEALEVRSLTLAIKEQQAKVKKLENSLSKMSQGRG